MPSRGSDRIDGPGQGVVGGGRRPAAVIFSRRIIGAGRDRGFGAPASAAAAAAVEGDGVPRSVALPRMQRPAAYACRRGEQ